MNALVMIAHGSRREEANTEFIALVERVRNTASWTYEFIEHCFLEIASPSLTEAVDHAIERGARDISVFPYFLNSGNHVLRDIPAMIDHLKRQHPTCEITMLPYVGAFDGMAELIARQVTDTR